MSKSYFVYIMMGFKGALYIGMTNSLDRRVAEHRAGAVPGFTRKYQCKYLVYFEEGADVLAVIEREKELKGWARAKKLNLIYRLNPNLRDLSDNQADPSLRSG
jgi:putative endonuclease